jgi:hypothetical protein
MSDEVITIELFRERVISLCVKRKGALLPRAPRDAQVLGKVVALCLPQGESMSESAINEALKAWLADVGSTFDVDHVTLRRFLVDTGFLTRSANGSSYSVTEASKQPGRFAAEVEKMDVAAFVHAARVEEELRRQAERAKRGQ